MVHEPVHLEVSSDQCDQFLHFFLEKIISTAALISPASHDPSILIPCLAEFVSLSFLEQLVYSLKPLGCPFDLVPSQPLKVFPTLGPFILTIINSSLTSSVVPNF